MHERGKLRQLQVQALFTIFNLFVLKLRFAVLKFSGVFVRVIMPVIVARLTSTAAIMSSA